MPISQPIVDLIESYNFIYYDVSPEEVEALLISYLEKLKTDFRQAGPDRILDWQKGWSENNEDFIRSNDTDSLSPKYFKNNILRFNGHFIRPATPDFEKNLQKIIISCISAIYLKDLDAIYEFGCGTGYNLLQINQINPNIKLIGTDWVSSSGEILRRLNSHFKIDCKFELFDFFKPDYNFKISENSAILTVTALEQIGTNFNKFLDYALSQDPKYCIHVEPIIEFLDPNASLLDYCMFNYVKKRNYLQGLYGALKKLEADGIVDIIFSRHVRCGSLWFEPYSILI